jgi:hypothetical protein
MVRDSSVLRAEVASATPHSTADAKPLQASSARRYRLYFLAVVLIPTLFLLSSIPIVRTASFPAESRDPFLLNLDYAFSLKHVDCAIVIFGDSTALTGLDPVTVERTTGLKTCNIAQSQSILEILGPLALDTYLQNNAPPKYLVLQLAPETLARADFFWPEGLTLLLRKKSIAAALPLLLRHPVQFYGFAIWAIKAKLKALTGSVEGFAATQAIFHARRGLLVLPKSPQTQCTRSAPYVPPVGSWVQTLREKYSVNGTRVLVYVGPVPSCDQNAKLIAANSADVADRPLTVYPIGLFNDLDRHLTLAGAERWSVELGQDIRDLDAGPRLKRHAF